MTDASDVKATFLGTGTSVGVPMIGCDCPVCVSGDPRNRRRRSSLYLAGGGVRLIVDTPPDFREQALEFRIPRVDAVLFTHSHADHVFGFDDIRRFNTIQNEVIPAYASAATVEDLKRVFSYFGQERIPGTYRPLVEFRVVREPFRVGGVAIRPLEVDHGDQPAYAFLFECEGRTLGYAPDCSGMSAATVNALRGIDVMILDALRHRPHPTHLTVAESLRLLERIGAKRSLMTHMAHDLDHAATQRDLPCWAELAFDGLVVEWG